MSSHSHDSEALDLLRRELHAAKVAWNEFLPPWARGVIGDGILRELLVAIDPPIHEGHIAPYASIIVDDANLVSPLVRLQLEHLDLARRAADGRSTVTVFDRDGFVGLLTLNPSLDPDLALARLAVSTSGIALHRNDKGHVRIYAPNGALRNIGRQWTQSPSIQEAVQTVMAVAPDVHEAVLISLLEFAYFILSPRHIGATIVWLLSDTNAFAGQGDDLTPLGLTTDDRSASRLLSFADHLLAQYDGATILSRDGKVIATGVQLTASDRAQQFVARLSGTRHTSAKRASFDCEETLVVTVSSDGPVTVFSDGASIFQLSWLSAREVAEAITRDGRQGVDGWMMFSSEGRVACSTCGKLCELETLKDPKATEPERQVTCPICASPLATVRCMEVRAMVRKTARPAMSSHGATFMPKPSP